MVLVNEIPRVTISIRRAETSQPTIDSAGRAGPLEN